jgi:hypothetical protein
MPRITASPASWLRRAAWLALALASWAAPSRLGAQEMQVAAPSSRSIPAFSVLDSSAMSIEHIDPLHSTSITLFSTLRKDDLLPRDIAIEFLPLLDYLTVRRAESRPRDRSPQRATAASEDSGNYFSETFGRYLAGSLAISQDVSSRDVDQSLSHVSIGLRTLLLSGRNRHQLDRLIAQYNDLSDTILGSEVKRDTPTQDGDKIAQMFIQLRELVQQIRDADKHRVGFMLETGLAQVLEVPQNTLADATVARRAYWLNPIYRFDERGPVEGVGRRWPFDFAGMIRLIDERQTGSNILDFGGRMVARFRGVHYSIEALGRKRFIELRLPGDDLVNARVVGGVSYGFNRSTTVNLTFGKNYKDDFARGGSLLASFGMTIGLGPIRVGIEPEMP